MGDGGECEIHVETNRDTAGMLGTGGSDRTHIAVGMDGTGDRDIEEGLEMIDWSEHHRYMPHSGWCGPTTIWMVLHACGVKQNINKIARAVWKKWYGTPPQLMAAYLARYFGEVGYEQNCEIKDIEWHLKEGRIVIVNWMDGDEGHYSIVIRLWNSGRLLSMVDSSRERKWYYTVDNTTFAKNWYDCLASDGRLRHDGLLIWVNPKSVKGTE